MAHTRPDSDTQYSEQNVLNDSYDKDFNTLAFELLGYDGSTTPPSLRRIPANAFGLIVDNAQYQSRREDTGSEIYYGEAEAGSLTSQSVWRIYRVTETDGIEAKEYADGNTNFDNSWSTRAEIPYGTEGGSGIGYWAIGSTFVVA